MCARRHLPGLISSWLGTRAPQESPLQIVLFLEAATTSHSARSAVRSQPQIDRLLDLQGNVIGEWPLDRLAGGRGEVGGVDDLEHGAAVLSGHQRLLVTLDAIDEVLHLLRET